jgi:calcyclin binding protein
LTIFLKKSKPSDYWDALEYKKPLVSDPKPDKSADPSAGLMDMMREMYENGDPEMKKIIAESWTKARTGDNKLDL